MPQVVKVPWLLDLQLTTPPPFYAVIIRQAMPVVCCCSTIPRSCSHHL